jgi:hypothetical protein
MLSLQRCREILAGNNDLDDNDLEHLRDQIYGLADVITDQIKHSMPNRAGAYQRGPVNQKNGFAAALRVLTDEEREEIEERAAIIEFEAGANRDEAERRAVLISVGKRHESKRSNKNSS